MAGIYNVRARHICRLPRCGFVVDPTPRGVTAHSQLIKHYLDVHGYRSGGACRPDKCVGLASDAEGRFGEYTPREFAI